MLGVALIPGEKRRVDRLIAKWEIWWLAHTHVRGDHCDTMDSIGLETFTLNFTRCRCSYDYDDDDNGPS